jgi:hypothetical protein
MPIFRESTHYQTLRRLGSWGRRSRGRYLLLEVPGIVENPVAKLCLDALEQDVRVDGPRVGVQTVEHSLSVAYANFRKPLGDGFYPVFLVGKQGLVRDRIHSEPACHHFLLIMSSRPGYLISR